MASGMIRLTIVIQKIRQNLSTAPFSASAITPTAWGNRQ
jgi:hypothetical protein